MDHLPGLWVEVLACLKKKRSWKTNSGPLQECKFVIATSPPSISAKSTPLTWKDTKLLLKTTEILLQILCGILRYGNKTTHTKKNNGRDINLGEN